MIFWCCVSMVFIVLNWCDWVWCVRVWCVSVDCGVDWLCGGNGWLWVDFYVMLFVFCVGEL